MAIGNINSSGISVGSDGRLTVSGFSSGIDWKALINAQIAAKRAPAVQLETKISKNNQLASVYTEMKAKISSVTTALDALRAAPGSETDVFKTKTASGSTTLATGAPPGHVPSGVDSLILASISNKAQAGTHTFTVQQLAQAHQVRTESFGSNTAALEGLGVPTGTFSINGKDIVVDADDSLLDVRSKINNSGAGVTATIVSADANTHYLVLTSNKTGQANEMAFGGDGDVLDGLGLTTGGGAVIRHPLREARNAIIDVNGITGIERAGNEVDDVIEGVTLSLLRAEPHTEITLKVEADLSSVKTAIGNLVTAYNDLRAFHSSQRTPMDRNNDGTIGDNEVGILATDRVLRDVVSKLGELMSTNVEGAADGFRSLSQLGVVVNQDFTLRIDDAIMDNKLLTNVDEVRKLFAFTTTVSDSRATVLSRGNDTASGTYYLNVTGTAPDGTLLGANIKTSAGGGVGNDGSATVTGRNVTGTGLTGASGLGIFFDGGANLGNATDIRIDVSRGIADLFYDFFNDVTKAAGRLDTEVNNLQAQNTSFQERVTVIDDRLAVSRKRMEAKFIAMETALAQLETVKSSVESYVNQLNAKK